MRIAHVTDCYLPRMGGIERQVHGLASAQLAAGHDVEVITSVPGPHGVAASEPGAAGEPAVIGPERPGLRPSSIRYGASLRGRRAVVDGGYDLVHVHASTFSPLSYLAAGAASRSGIATVATLHSLWSYATPIFRGFDAALDWRRWPITWTAVSTVAADSLSQVLLPGTEISVLPNGVSPELWQVERRPRDRQRVGIVSVMRLAARKRPMQLLKMLRLARAWVPADIAIEVQIIGDGPKRQPMLDYLQRHRMADWVHLCGQLDQPTIRQRLADADLYVSPATLESFGIAALEAHCAGLPVLAFARTGVSDFIEHQRNGLLVNSDEQMAAALAELIKTPGARAALAGEQGAGSNYSWNRMLDNCDQVYRRAFEQARTQPARTQPFGTQPFGTQRPEAEPAGSGSVGH